MFEGRRLWQNVCKAYGKYSNWIEKQGFYIVLTVCVLVIALSALYTFHFRDEWTAEEELESESVTVGIQEAQTLHEAQLLIQSVGARETVLPTEQPYRFTEPVDGILIRDFSMKEPQLFAYARYWRVHPGIDLQADYGTIVKACASGKVVNVWMDPQLGNCVRIRHENGYESVCAGLIETGYVQPGDPVMQGQTIGHVGNGVWAESDAEPHLHFEVWRNETALDPISVFLGTAQP